MTPTLALVLALGPTPGGPLANPRPLGPVAVPADAPFGFTYAPARDLDRAVRLPAARYDPRPGDVVLMSDPTPLSRFFYALARTGAPGHGGLVVRRPDGSMGLLEAGFNEETRVRLVPLDFRLTDYPGTVWVRRRAGPPTADQDARLTAFAVAADDTPYRVLGVALQVTQLKRRGLLRTSHLGRPRGPGGPLICSEAILEGLAYAGLIDADTARPAATYPRDLFFDRSHNPFIHRHPPLAAGWDPPALWTPVVGVAEKGKDRPPPAPPAVAVPPPADPPSARRFRR